MKLAIMQPYIFPYLGYFQLINAVDRFVFYDDVNFIKQGWINRNRILLNGKGHLFSLPIKNVSSFNSIRNTKLHSKLYLVWKKNFLETLKQSYCKSINFLEVLSLIENVLNTSDENVSALCKSSVITICNYLGIEKDFVNSSLVYENGNLKSVDRVLDICKKENATSYINMAGGIDIYNKNDFRINEIELCFLTANLSPYKQFDFPFVSGLSIIDVLMFNRKQEVLEFINAKNIYYE